MIRTLVALIALTLVATPVAYASSYKPSSAGVKLEVVMSEDGRARVSGARVREVFDGGLVAETLWGSGKITWTVQTSEDTPIYRKSGARIALADVTPGDYVSFAGAIRDNLPPFTIEADSVRDWSISDNHVVLSGTIDSIDRDARTFTLVTGKGNTITIKVDEKTTYAQSGAQTFSDFSVGDEVLAFGDKAGAAVIAAHKMNLTERAVARTTDRPVIATGLGSWVDRSLSLFFVGRIN